MNELKICHEILISDFPLKEKILFNSHDKFPIFCIRKRQLNYLILHKKIFIFRNFLRIFVHEILEQRNNSRT